DLGLDPDRAGASQVHSAADAPGIGITILFVWIYGGYHVPDVALGPGKRWPFFLGLGSSCFTCRSTPTGSTWSTGWRMTLARGGGRRAVGVGDGQGWTGDSAGVDARDQEPAGLCDASPRRGRRAPGAGRRGQRRRGPAAPAGPDAARDGRPHPLHRGLAPGRGR